MIAVNTTLIVTIIKYSLEYIYYLLAITTLDYYQLHLSHKADVFISPLATAAIEATQVSAS